MKKVMQKALSVLLAVLLCTTSLPLISLADEVIKPREWFVSIDGDDINGTGTIDKPFRTLQKGADMLGAGDVLYIRKGIYDEAFTVKSSGTAENPITIKAYNGEDVTIRATTELSGWSKVGNNIWSVDMPWNMEDLKSTNMLFKGENSLILARHPNISEGGSLMWPDLLTMDWADRLTESPTRTGVIHDAELTQPDGYWDGAVAHMQAGLNWFNVVADVDSYTTGVLNIKNHDYASSSWYDEKAENTYYLKDHFNALDAEKEWWFDRQNYKMFLYSSTDPNLEQYGSRSSNFVVDLSGQSYINVENINFLAAPPVVKNAHHINFEWITLSGIPDAFVMNGEYITIKHSHIYDSPESLISIKGKYNAVFNCLIENAGWNGKGGVCIQAKQAMYAYVGYCTLRNAGRSCFGPGSSNAVYEFNDIYNAGSLTHDTGVTYTYVDSAGTTELRYNWIHDMTAAKTGFGLYYDNGNSDLVIHHNVVWDNDNETGELLNNGWVALCLNDTSVGMSVYNNTFIGDAHMSRTLGIANDSRLMNNIFTGEIQTSLSFAAQRNNIVGWLNPGFNDLYNYDFSLREDSIAIDKGIHIEGITDNYVGDAPDVGAYEYGAEIWIPGHNWENPPAFEHQVPNYVKWHNVVAMAGFESGAGELLNPDYYGWSVMDETKGLVTTTFHDALVDLQTVRRTGNRGIQLGQNLPTVYPGDEAAKLSTEIVDIYDQMNLKLLNYPERNKQKLYNNLPQAFYSLLINSTNMFPEGDFENLDVEVRSVESTVASTDEEAYSGERSAKVENMKYSWSGPRITFPATGHRQFRISLKVKGEKGSSLEFRFTDHLATDYNRVNDRFLGSSTVSLSDSEWTPMSFDIDTKGSTQGLETEMYYGKWNNGSYYLDDLVVLDITELYLLQEVCAKNAQAKKVVDEAINNKFLTAESMADAVKRAVEIMIASDKDKAVKMLLPMFITMRDSKLSAGAGITYTIDNLKPGRTYKMNCHAWVTDQRDKVQFFVKQGNTILAQWETNSQKWTNYALLFDPPSNGEPVTIEVWKPIGVAAAYVDDVGVREYDATVYKSRKTSLYIENGDIESGEIWPWYSFDGKLELASTDRGTSLKVTDGRAMQDVVPLPNRKTYIVSGDFKLAMPGVSSKEVELRINTIEGKSNGEYASALVGKAKITNDSWVTIKGNFDVPADLAFTSIGCTAGLVGEKGSFYLDNIKIEEMPLPTTPGTGDGMTFEQIMADTKNWVSTSEDQGLSITKTSISTTNGVIGYIGENFRDFRFTFEMMIEGFASGHYPSMTIRNNNGAKSFSNGYTFIIRDTNIELQKYGSGIADNYMYVGTPESPSGAYGPATQTTAFKMNEWNTVTVGSVNKENGVHIYLEVNGEVIYDCLDTASMVDPAGYICFARNGSDRISIRTVQK